MRKKLISDKSAAALSVFALAFSLSRICSAAVAVTSDPEFVFLRPQESSFWRTAANGALTLPVRYPAAASSATLTVKGLSYIRVYEEVPEGDFELELPTPASPEDEDVFTLTLAFDDGTRRSARLGIVQGMLPGTEGSTRCIVPKDGRKWNTVRGRAVLPVPFGVKSFSVLVNGKEIANEDDLDGAKGWYAVSGLKTGDEIDVSLAADASHFVSALVCRNSNFSIIIR